MVRRLLATSALAVLTAVCGCCSMGNGPLFPRLWGRFHGGTMVEEGCCPSNCPCEGPILDGGGMAVAPPMGPPPPGPVPPPGALVPGPAPQTVVPPLAPAPTPRLVPTPDGAPGVQAAPRSYTPIRR
jgi:hypothetical protein